MRKGASLLVWLGGLPAAAAAQAQAEASSSSTFVASGIAVCVGGRADVEVPDMQGQLGPGGAKWEAIKILNGFVAEPLGAELFLYLSFRRDKGISTDMHNFIHTSPRVVVKQFDFLDPRRHLDSLLQQLEDGHAENRTWLPTMLKKGYPHLRWFLTLLQWQACFEAVKMVEQRDEQKYRYVMFTRLDLIWLAQHPPLSVIQATRCPGQTTVWGLEGEEYGGINDRYLLAERPAADTVAGLWQSLQSFRPVDDVKRFARGHGVHSRPEPQSAERILLHALLHAGHCVRRVTSVASVVHSGESNALPDYLWERLSAVRFARLLHEGGRWEPAPEEPYLVGGACGALLGLKRELRRPAMARCCSAASLPFGGHDRCWQASLLPRMYSLQRCCQRGHVAVTIRPHQNTVRAWVNGSGDDIAYGTRRPALAAWAQRSSGSDARWHCLPFGPDSSSIAWSDSRAGVLDMVAQSKGLNVVWGAEKIDSLPIGVLQCYDVRRLAEDLAGRG